MTSRKLLTYTVAALVAILVITGILTWNSDDSQQAATRIVQPERGAIVLTISTTGVVQPQNRLELKPPISGRLEQILVKEGDRVKEGQVLAWMSSTDRAALLDAARAQGADAVAYWEQVYKPTPLLATIDGQVIVRAVEPGQTVTPSDAILVLSDRLIVNAQVDETDIGRVQVGQRAIVGLDAYPEVRVTGIVDHISYESKLVNNVTVYEVDILPERIPDVFRSGMSSNIEIEEHVKENALLVPREAVKRDKQGTYVLVATKDGKEPQRRPVDTGLSNEQQVEVTNGLSETDRIVVVADAYYSNSRQGGTSSPLLPFGRRR
jgi:macrolide-specific efflux system membrane fusion protein